MAAQNHDRPPKAALRSVGIVRDVTVEVAPNRLRLWAAKARVAFRTLQVK